MIKTKNIIISILTAFILLLISTSLSHAAAISIPPIDENNEEIGVTHTITRGDMKAGKPYKLTFDKDGKIFDKKVSYDTSKEYEVNSIISFTYDTTGESVYYVKDGIRYALHSTSISTPPKYGEEHDEDVLTWHNTYELVKIEKKDNPLNVSGKTKIIRQSKKSRYFPFSHIIKIKGNGEGKITYKKLSGNNKISINKKTGRVTVKGKLKKGTYKIKASITASGNELYKAKTQKVTSKIKVI